MPLLKGTKVRRDFRFTYGENFRAVIKLYEDPRLERWRGLWKPFYAYDPGEGSEWKEAAYVALLKTEHSEPGGPGSSPFWSPMVQANLSGANVEFSIVGVYTYKPTIKGGEVELSIAPANFAAATSSAEHYLKVTDSGGVVIYPVIGTAIFNQP